MASLNETSRELRWSISVFDLARTLGISPERSVSLSEGVQAITHSVTLKLGGEEITFFHSEEQPVNRGTSSG